MQTKYEKQWLAIDFTQLGVVAMFIIAHKCLIKHAIAIHKYEITTHFHLDFMEYP